MKESKYTFAFFPYLKTSAVFEYRSLIIRSSNDHTDLPSAAIPYFEALHSMFFLRDHLRIKNMSYAFHSTENEKFSSSDFIQQLIEFQTIISFIYSVPHSTFGEPFLRYEHASLYLFKPKRVSKHLLANNHNLEVLPEAQRLKFDSKDEIEGYEGRLNNKSYFWVTSGSRIFPPALGLWLNIFQDLGEDFNYRLTKSRLYEPVVDYFARREENDALGERILTALTWYNKSIAIDIDESEALVNLAIAFESLLNLEAGDKIADRFREAVTILIGGVPRLDSWLAQFYKARSQIVHEGRSSNLMFIATDDPKKCVEPLDLEYRSLVSYGRQIFQICIAAMLTGARIAAQLRLPSLFMTNQQRLQRICQVLTKGKGTPTDKIMAVAQDAYDIENFRFVVEKGLKVKQLIATAKLIIEQYLDSTPKEPPELIKQMRGFVRVNSTDHYKALSLLRKIQESFKPKSMVQRSVPKNLRSIVSSLIDSIWSYTFMYYFDLAEGAK